MASELSKDISKLTKNLSDLEKKQIPFSTSLALNQVAQDAQRRAQRRLRIDLDRPTPFTIRGIGVSRSSKRKLQSAVFIKDIQADYLKYAIFGGTRRPANRAITVPVKARLNKFGNIPRKKIQSLLTRSDVFVVRDSQKAGIYQRMKSGKLKMLIAFESTAVYKRRYDFKDIVVIEANKRITPAMRQALKKALSTMKK